MDHHMMVSGYSTKWKERGSLSGVMGEVMMGLGERAICGDLDSMNSKIRENMSESLLRTRSMAKERFTGLMEASGKEIGMMDNNTVKENTLFQMEISELVSMIKENE